MANDVRKEPANRLLPERMRVSSQQLLDLGLNVFGLHLFLESVAKRFKPRGDERDAIPLEFEFEATKEG